MVKRSLNKMLNTVLLTLCLVILISLTGCFYKGYSGKNTDLYTVAINSVLWNLGHSYGADRAIDSQIEILEKDEFGRTLFIYREKYYSCNSISFSSLMILQTTLDGYAYYYEDYNYLNKKQEAYSPVLQDFDSSEIEYLKSINDWGKELDLTKCSKKQISRDKQVIPTNTAIIEKEVLSKYNPTNDRCKIFLDLLTMDAKGNFIIYGLLNMNNGNDILFVAFVNSEYEVVDWLIPEDLYNYQQELREFKLKNDWVIETK